MLLQQCGDQDGINIQLIGGFFEATDLPEIGMCVRGGDSWSFRFASFSDLKTPSIEALCDLLNDQTDFLLRP